jgi:hypothetical protein
MTNLEFHLKRMLVSVESLLKQTNGVPFEEYLRSHLVPVQCELERQLKCELARQTEEVRSTDRFA